MRDFAQAEIAPHSEEWNAAHHVPVEVLGRMAELGFLGVIIPEEYGGAGLDYASLVIVMEEVAAADAGLSTGLAVQNSLGAAPILRNGTDAQKDAFLPALASGERFAAYALTEPDAGSDTANIRTAARADGDGWVVSGAKQWITSGGFASVFVLYARTGEPGAKGISCFLAEPGDGFTVGREIPKLGLHTSSTVELTFDGHRVGGRARCSARRARGSRSRSPRSTRDGSSSPRRPRHRARGARGGGVLRARPHRLRRADRPPPGRPVPAGRGRGQLDAARLLTMHAARLRDAGEPHSAAGAKAKLFASQVAVEAADTCVQTLGGYGYSAEYPAERLYRDAKITQIYEGRARSGAG